MPAACVRLTVAVSRRCRLTFVCASIDGGLCQSCVLVSTLGYGLWRSGRSYTRAFFFFATKSDTVQFSAS